LNATLIGLLLGTPVTESSVITARMPFLEVSLDAGTGTVAGGGAIVSIIGAILWRRKEDLLALPNEWEG